MPLLWARALCAARRTSCLEGRTCLGECYICSSVLSWGHVGDPKHFVVWNPITQRLIIFDGTVGKAEGRLLSQLGQFPLASECCSQSPVASSWYQMCDYRFIYTQLTVEWSCVPFLRLSQCVAISGIFPHIIPGQL